MLDKIDLISRRTFLERGLIGLGSMALLPMYKGSKLNLDEWPQSEFLGRNTVYLPNTLKIRSKPNAEATIIRYPNEDECLVWLRDIVGEKPSGRNSRRWVETPEGYVYAPSLQKVKNIPNEPITVLPEANGEIGMWVEVTVPYVNLTLINPMPNAPWLQEASVNMWRLYYSQVVWISDIRTENGVLQYRVTDEFGYGDEFWANADAFRLITPDEIAPINPDAADKKIIVDVNQQNLTCYEGTNEVYFCQVSTGQLYDSLTGSPSEEYETPVGEYWIWRKLLSLHMSGGETGAGWDTMAIPWTSLFVGAGMAIHGTFWHNDFGTARSHGCVNTLPEDAKWIFRWTSPQVSYVPGDITDNTYSGTKIQVVKRLY